MYKKIETIRRSSSPLLKLEEVKSYLRVTEKEDDLLIKDIIEAAIEYAENFMGKFLNNKTFCMTQEGDIFPQIKLPTTKVNKIIKVEIIENNNRSVLDETQYSLSGTSTLSFVYPIICQKIIVEYSVGLCEGEELPSMIKQGLLNHISCMYDYRGVSTEVPKQTIVAYSPYRRIRV